MVKGLAGLLLMLMRAGLLDHGSGPCALIWRWTRPRQA